jgi:hypothetical protein
MQGDPETGGPVGQVVNWVFIAFLFIAQGRGCLSGADRHFLGRRSVFLANYHLLGLPVVHPSEAMQGISLYSYLYLNLTEMLCFSYYHLRLLFNKIGEEGRSGSAWK